MGGEERGKRRGKGERRGGGEGMTMQRGERVCVGSSAPAERKERRVGVGRRSEGG